MRSRRRYTLPAAFDVRDYVDVGGLLSYGSDYLEVMRRAGGYVGRILNRRTAVRLAGVQSAKFEFLVINTKTAETLGLTVPPTLLALADAVIE